MNENMTPEVGVERPLLPNIDVTIYPQHREKLLAYAKIDLGGVFAITGVRVQDSEKGIFVSMPSRKGEHNKFYDICFPTTPEMRQAVNEAVIGAYKREIQKMVDRTDQAVEKYSMRDQLRAAQREAAARPAPAAARAVGGDAR